MKKTVSLILCAILCCALLCACGKETANEENLFTKSPYEVAEKIEAEFDMDDASFYKDTDEYAIDAIMYQYGIEDEAVLSAIDKYAFTTPGTNSAKTFAVITFKEGTSAETIAAAEKAIKDVYIANLINTTAVYDMTQSEIADKASFLVYDNALVVIAYDANGNTALIEAIK